MPRSRFRDFAFHAGGASGGRPLETEDHDGGGGGPVATEEGINTTIYHCMYLEEWQRQDQLVASFEKALSSLPPPPALQPLPPAPSLFLLMPQGEQGQTLRLALEEAGVLLPSSPPAPPNHLGRKDAARRSSTAVKDERFRSYEYTGGAMAFVLGEQAWGEGQARLPPISHFKRGVYDPLSRHLMRSVGEAAASPITTTQLVLVACSGEEMERAKMVVAVDMLTRGLQASHSSQQGANLTTVVACEEGTVGGSAPESEVEMLVKLEAVSCSLGFAPVEELRLFICRLVLACRRDTAVRPMGPYCLAPAVAGGCAKPLPSQRAVEGGDGLRVFEFFSGIGGMRLALPESVHGLPIRHITAFDCDQIVGDVYDLNFHTDPPLDRRDSVLRRILIDGLKVEDVDGRADIWTMSPPCQPYTKTRLALCGDERDNRSRGIVHLMSLLLGMREKPRWIVLENVKGFYGSQILTLWKSKLKECGYRWEEYMLTPLHAVGIPNHRMRYYMIAEHGGGGQAALSTSTAPLHHCLPLNIRARFPATTPPIGSFIRHDLDASELQELYLPLDILDKSWAITRLSLVSDRDTQSHCFTKGYGRIFDRSTGSCYLEGGPRDPAAPLASLHGRLRLFHPEEVLAISGLPPGFRWPSFLPLRKRWACIGNSVNVEVVKGVMACLFEKGLESADEEEEEAVVAQDTSSSCHVIALEGEELTTSRNR